MHAAGSQGFSHFLFLHQAFGFMRDNNELVLLQIAELASPDAVWSLNLRCKSEDVWMATVSQSYVWKENIIWSAKRAEQSV